MPHLPLKSRSNGKAIGLSVPGAINRRFRSDFARTGSGQIKEFRFKVFVSPETLVDDLDGDGISNADVYVVEVKGC